MTIEQTKPTESDNAPKFLVRIVDEKGNAWWIKPHLVRWMRPALGGGSSIDVAGVHLIHTKESPDEVAKVLRNIADK